MPKPLRLFIRPPYDNPPGLWTRVYGYGPQQPLPPPPTPPTIHSHVLLRTTGAGELFAAATGKLSVRPPASGALDPTEAISVPAPGAAPPDAVNLYLHLSPLVAQDPMFRARESSILHFSPHFASSITGFAYLNVETASLETALAGLLDIAVVVVSVSDISGAVTGEITRAQIVELLVRGDLDILVYGGHAIGNASARDAPSGTRQVGFTVLTGGGPVDPSHVYDWMRDFVEDGQPDVDRFLNLTPKQWPLIDPILTDIEAINLTEVALYPMPVLSELRNSRNLSAAQWRQVGDNQKALWRDRLLRRTGHAPPDSSEPPFEFDDLDWKNTFQLEAVVEFYANFDDPWAIGAVPRNPSTAGFITIDFLDPAGTAATVIGNVVTLDGTSDLTRVRTNHDTLFIESDTARPTRLYRITGVNATVRTVTLDGTPVLTGDTSPWEINLRPILVIIDSFGGRLQGSSATVSAANTLTLDGPPNLSRVNANFDTIYLPSDTARAKRTYRITGVNDAAHTVTLDDNPILDSGLSRWHIPAGISGELPALFYNLGPGGARGYDHFDGVLFTLQGGTVYNKTRFATYTSRSYPPGAQELSSLRGNKRYDFSSWRSGKASRNYSLKVIDPGAAYDGVREARFYFSTPVVADSVAPPAIPNIGGKTVIRIHFSVHNSPGHGCSSAGCIVSPAVYGFRDRLIDLYQDEYQAFHGPGTQDTEVQKAYGRDHAQSQTLWNNTATGIGAAANRLTYANWNDKIVGTLWVVRPDERPLG